MPGPDESAAAWLADRKIKLTGAETIAYECIYPERGHALLPVHRMLLVEEGIHIIEVLNLTELAAGRHQRVPLRRDAAQGRRRDRRAGAARGGGGA